MMNTTSTANSGTIRQKTCTTSAQRAVPLSRISSPLLRFSGALRPATLVRHRTTRSKTYSSLAERTLEQQHDGPVETAQRGEGDRSHETDFVIVGSGIGGERHAL